MNLHLVPRLTQEEQLIEWEQEDSTRKEMEEDSISRDSWPWYFWLTIEIPIIAGLFWIL